MSFNDYKSMRDIPFLLPEKMKYAKFKRWPLTDAKYCSLEDLVKYISWVKYTFYLRFFKYV